MTELKNVMEIFKLLNKSNCRDCNEKTCLAFAAAVFENRKQLNECPHLDEDIKDRFSGKIKKTNTMEEEQEKIIDSLKQKIAATNLSSISNQIGGSFANNKLTLKVFGKDFIVRPDGNLESDIHINPWITIPLLSYILTCQGIPISNRWVPFRELKNGKTWHRLFHQQCELPFKKIADTHTVLFEDLIHIFNGNKVENHYESDIALALLPLPKIPLLVCYWKPEDGLESDFNLFFDSTAEENSSIEAIYSLGTGLVRMFEKLSLRHGI